MSGDVAVELVKAGLQRADERGLGADEQRDHRFAQAAGRGRNGAQPGQQRGSAAAAGVAVALAEGLDAGRGEPGCGLRGG